ncbi:PEP-CTERM sorting domain-containing protein [Planctomycetota bacterium]
MKKVAIAFVAAVMCCCICSAQAAIITLSEFSSDSTPADVLDAAVEFSIVDSQLTIVISNLTDGLDGGEDNGFDIMSLFFNVTDNVTGLTLTTPSTGWKLCSFSNITKAGGFGQFDYALIDVLGSSSNHIDGESSKTFTLSLTHDGSGVSDLDFYTDLSSIPPGDNAMYLAAKFVRGPDDDSAFGGNNAPEPATIALLGFGSLALIRRKRAA